MNNIPPKLRREMAADPLYTVCARKGYHGHECQGRITWEHVTTWAGKQLQMKSFIIPLCSYAHSVGRFQDGGDLDKGINMWIALTRASDDELLELSRKGTDYFQMRYMMNKKYGEWVAPRISEKRVFNGINYGTILQ